MLLLLETCLPSLLPPIFAIQVLFVCSSLLPLLLLQVLSRIRGTTDVEEELEDMAEAARISNLAPHPMRNLFKAQYRPQLVISLMFMMFQQFTGINAIIFYAPVLFNSIGSGHTASLLNTVIIGAGETQLISFYALANAYTSCIYATGTYTMMSSSCSHY